MGNKNVHKMNDIYLYLPFPPPLRSYYIRGKILSKRARAFRAEICGIIFENAMNLGVDYPVDFTVIIYPPDRRVRDLDNHLKSLQDSLTHAGVWVDDSQVRQLHVYRGEIVKGGKCVVRIRKATEIVPNNADLDALGI